MKSTMLSSYPKHFTSIPILLTFKSQHLHVVRFPIKCSSSSDSNNNTTSINENSKESQPVTPPITPPNTVEIRFSRRPSKRRKQKEEEMMNARKQAVKPKPPPKDWESMNLTEKAIELYVGEKGLLFWLNKFAYASIFIIIGGWILFRFVGPALDLYQLDTPTPLAPESMFKGSGEKP
ncbi:uncharacterized protein LOC132046456 [Lycium ferocissimum]|uniref:uncharacterized protein LOC132046456 n=1 Tax=Lycium ferocissimum TaxID=112874 RepID=UPI00281541DA|nr:uncharacterized protein LOC132046456 [Lycium ferocissimum]